MNPCPKKYLAEIPKQMQNITGIEIEIKNITTHGRTGAVNGLFLSENDKSYAFVICTNSL